MLLPRTFFVEKPSRLNAKSWLPSVTRIEYVPSLAVLTVSSSPLENAPRTMRMTIPRCPAGVGVATTETPESAAPFASVTLPVTSTPLGIVSTKLPRRSPGANFTASDVAGGKPFFAARSLRSASLRTRKLKRPSGPETVVAPPPIIIARGLKSKFSPAFCVLTAAATTGFFSSLSTTPLTRASGVSTTSLETDWPVPALTSRLLSSYAGCVAISMYDPGAAVKL